MLYQLPHDRKHFCQHCFHNRSLSPCSHHSRVRTSHQYKTCFKTNGTTILIQSDCNNPSRSHMHSNYQTSECILRPSLRNPVVHSFHSYQHPQNPTLAPSNSARRINYLSPATPEEWTPFHTVLNEVIPTRGSRHNTSHYHQHHSPSHNCHDSNSQSGCGPVPNSNLYMMSGAINDNNDTAKSKDRNPNGNNPSNLESIRKENADGYTWPPHRSNGNSTPRLSRGRRVTFADDVLG